MYYLLTLIIIFTACSNISPNSQISGEKPLKIIHLSNNLELSSMSLTKNNKVLFVADSITDHFVYQTDLQDLENYSNLINLNKLTNATSYFSSLKQKGERTLDLEGVDTCKEIIYLVNERSRDILIIKNNSLEVINIPDFLTDKTIKDKLNQGGPNAGFEGIAIDCEKNHAYIAKERSPRIILVFDLNRNQLIDSFDFPADSTIADNKKLNPDISELKYQNGYLYIMERNAHQIVKWDIANKKIISKFKYLNETQLYDTGEEYGLAESFILTNDYIYIGLDNNQNTPNKLGIDLGLKKTPNPVIFVYPRGKF